MRGKESGSAKARPALDRRRVDDPFRPTGVARAAGASVALHPWVAAKMPNPAARLACLNLKITTG
jgi:hypothetical protein